MAALLAAFTFPAAPADAPTELPVTHVPVCAAVLGDGGQLWARLAVPIEEAREVSPTLDPAVLDAYYCEGEVPA